MTTRAPRSSGLDTIPPVVNSETTSLLRYNPSNATRPEEEEPLLPKSSPREASLKRDSKPPPSLFARSSIDWVFYKLTGRTCDEVSLSLQNSGSVARDHLALERTFLAYMRTSLAIASAGVALVQLFNTSNKAESERVEKYARPLGASVIAMGLIVLGVGLARYFTVQSALVKGIFPVARLSAIFIAVALTALVTVVFSLLVTDKFKLN